MRYLLLMLALSGCSLQVDELPGLAASRYNPAPKGHCAADVAMGVHLFATMWTQENPGSDIAERVQQGLIIESWPAPRQVGDQLRAGQTFDRNHFGYGLLYYHDSGDTVPLGFTSFGHELIHVALWKDNDDPDPEHHYWADGGEAFETRINETLMAMPSLCEP